MNLETQSFVLERERRYLARYTETLADLFAATAAGDTARANWARAQFAEVLAAAMGLAEIAGASVTLRQAADVMVEEHMHADLRELVCFKESKTTELVLPHVELQDAIADLLARTPVVLQDPALRTAREVSRLYSQGRVIAFAQATEQKVVEDVQRLLAKALREGMTQGEAVDWMRKIAPDWSAGYAATAFRTNLSTAVTAGKFRQAHDPVVQAVVPAFMFSAVGDSDTRPNHEAANHHIWRVDNPIWNELAPPLGFNCRCDVHAMPRPMLRRMGRLDANGNVIESAVPPGAHPDEGFRHGPRPDLFLGATA